VAAGLAAAIAGVSVLWAVAVLKVAVWRWQWPMVVWLAVEDGEAVGQRCRRKAPGVTGTSEYRTGVRPTNSGAQVLELYVQDASGILV
jgi:hypothetical protein